MKHYRRSLEELWARWKYKAKSGTFPFEYTCYADVERAMASLRSYDREEWAAIFSAAAAPYRERAREAEARGQDDRALRNYLRAYGYYRLARFPTTNSPAKEVAYTESREMFVRAARYFDHSFERVQIPFQGRPGEGRSVIGYLCRAGVAPPAPLVVHWGGFDSFKEERYRHIDVPGMLAAGLPVLLIDMPGTGEAPVKGSLDAERMFDAVLDWVGITPEFDARRVCFYGGSFGGYYATKLAHTRADRLACVVNHGGCIHHAFDPDWIERAQHGEYAFDYAESNAHAFGLASADEWVEFAPRLSLLDMGLLERPCAPMLIVNGIYDSIFPLEDAHLLLEHGDPKTARFYRRGHMGMTRDTLPTMARWMATMLCSAAEAG